MELLTALGINHYAIYQFFIFILMFIFLTQVVFKPFLMAHEARLSRTKGGEQLADEFGAKADAARLEYVEKARDINNQIQSIFQNAKIDAQAQAEKTISEARTQADAIVEKNRAEINSLVQKVSEELNGQTTSVSLAITNKLLGK